MECDGERSQERQQQEGTVQCRMIKRDDGELVQERIELCQETTCYPETKKMRIGFIKTRSSVLMSWEFIAR